MSPIGSNWAAIWNSAIWDTVWRQIVINPTNQKITIGMKMRLT